MIGKPSLTPFWSLGWHASSNAYKTQADIQANIDGYATAGIPLEGIWLDIPYLDRYADFSVNTTAFPDLKALTDSAHSNGQRIIPIIDGGLSADNLSNEYIMAANQDNLLILSTINTNDTSDFLIQHGRANKTAFLDFFNPKSVDVWQKGLNDLYKKFPYDGAWLDMNEATGFCNGECPSGVLLTILKPDIIKSSFLGDEPNDVANYTWWYSYNS
jgi:alpha-glucosidase